MSKRDYYDVLGLVKSATDDDIKKAYRKLSSAHHPDKHTEPAEKTKHEAIFKEVKEAYETLSDPQKRAAYDNYGHQDPNQGWQQAAPGDLGDIFEQLRRARGGFHPGGFNQGNFKHVSEFQAGVTLKEAFNGFPVKIQLPDGSSREIKVQAGTPEGYRFKTGLTPNIDVIVVTRINDPNFRVKNPNECGWHQKVINGKQVVIIETGDIETTIKVDAIDIILGTWASVTNFDDDKLQVRVPAGLTSAQRLKVKGKGYYHWMHELNKPGERGDLYVRIEPVFKPLKEIPLEKAEALVTAVRALQEPA